MHKFVKQVSRNCFVFLAVLLKFVMAFIYSHLSMPGGQSSHFRDKMSPGDGTPWVNSGRSRPFRDGWPSPSRNWIWWVL